MRRAAHPIGTGDQAFVTPDINGFNRPTNVRFGPDGCAYVVDYGAVRDQGADSHVVEFRPETNTDAVNPGGRLMDGGNVGLKFAVLSVQIGFATTLLAATAWSGRSGARAHAAATACKRLSSMTTVPSLPCLSHRGTFVLRLLY